ncbi:Uncharacterized protein EbC_pEb17200900 (plasmid) [Erwinia billingiae Eb661]|uniref:Uncharacterized protein n=1 Tax=Erwinia billingiae (strain Eb661) TaxID=634500 RepID=D8MJU5_ERWBE|nr:Uncharacterized protein EbC_pEb17200900 [Erwinia billingiae Eb661]
MKKLLTTHIWPEQPTAPRRNSKPRLTRISSQAALVVILNLCIAP